MSLDTEVYARAPLSLTEIRPKLPESESWELFEGELAHEGDGWQVLVGEPDEIEPEAVPPNLAALLPDARYRFSLILEPIGAAEEGKAFLEEVLRAIGAATGGVAYDFRSGAPTRFASQ